MVHRINDVWNSKWKRCFKNFVQIFLKILWIWIQISPLWISNMLWIILLLIYRSIIQVQFIHPSQSVLPIPTLTEEKLVSFQETIEEYKFNQKLQIISIKRQHIPNLQVSPSPIPPYTSPLPFLCLGCQWFSESSESIPTIVLQGLSEVICQILKIFHLLSLSCLVLFLCLGFSWN